MKYKVCKHYPSHESLFVYFVLFLNKEIPLSQLSSPSFDQGGGASILTKTTLTQSTILNISSTWEDYYSDLKGNSSEDAPWPENVKDLRICSSAHFVCMVILAIFMQQRYCSAPKLCSSGRSHTGSFFTNEEQKGLAHDVNDTRVPHAGLLHDNTDSDRKWQRSQRVFTTFSCRYLTN